MNRNKRSFKKCQKYIKEIEIPASTKTQEPEIVVLDGPIKKYDVASEDISRPIYSSKESSETMLGTYELMEATPCPSVPAEVENILKFPLHMDYLVLF